MKKKVVAGLIAVLFLALAVGVLYADDGDGDGDGDDGDATDATGAESPTAAVEALFEATEADDKAAIIACYTEDAQAEELGRVAQMCAMTALFEDGKLDGFNEAVADFGVELEDNGMENVMADSEAFMAACKEVEDKAGLWVAIWAWYDENIPDYGEEAPEGQEEPEVSFSETIEGTSAIVTVTRTLGDQEYKMKYRCTFVDGAWLVDGMEW